MISRREIEKLKDETGFDGELLEKIFHLSRIISHLSKKEIIRENLALKGGTSLNFIYLDLPRLSIDLDFNFIGAVDKDGMKRIRAEIEKEIIRTGKDLGYITRNKGSSYIISRDLYSYEKLNGIKDHVKIEINYIQRLPLSAPVKRRFRSIFSGPMGPMITTHSLEELCAQKVIACVDRQLPRDIFDVEQYSRMDMDIDLARRMTAVYFCINSNKKDPDLSTLDSIDPAILDMKLKQFVRKGSMRSSEDLIKNARAFMEKLFDLDKGSRKFIDDFYSKGVINSELIFPGGPDISSHPSLLYRLEQIGK